MKQFWKQNTCAWEQQWSTQKHLFQTSRDFTHVWNFAGWRKKKKEDKGERVVCVICIIESERESWKERAKREQRERERKKRERERGLKYLREKFL